MAENNELSTAYKYKVKGSDNTLKATYRAYLPKFQAGIAQVKADKTSPLEPDSVTTTYITASAVLFDGFKRKNLIKEKKALKESSQYDYGHFKKSIALDTTKLYYSILTLRAKLKALKAKKDALKEEVYRLKKFYEVGNITKDKLEQIRSAYYQADYELIMAKLNEERAKDSLESMVGKKIDKLKPSHFLYSKTVDSNREDIKSLESKIKALKYTAKQQMANYYPAVTVEVGKYSYDYGKSIPGAVDEQTKINFNLKLLEFDFFSKSKAEEAVTANRLALQNQLIFQKRSIKTEQKIALKKIEASKKRIEAAKLMAEASKTTFELINKKHIVGVADNVEYLNALTNKFNAEALLENSKNDYQTAIAEYYYQTGVDIKERLQ